MPVREAEEVLKKEEEHAEEAAKEANGQERTTTAEEQSSQEESVVGTEPASSASTTPVTAAHKWVKHVDAASGKPYYHDTVSGKTQWEEPVDFVDAPPMSAAAAEYQAHLNRVRTERLTRVTQQVLDPSGSLGRLNAILSGINPGGAAGVQEEDKGDEAEDDARKGMAKAEWQQHVDPHTQRFYYHNTVTGVTQWQKPDAPVMSGVSSSCFLLRPSTGDVAC